MDTIFNSPARDLIRQFVGEAERGMLTAIACGTSVTKPELSLFLGGHRDLTADKVLEILDWLLTKRRVSMVIDALGIPNED